MKTMKELWAELKNKKVSEHTDTDVDQIIFQIRKQLAAWSAAEARSAAENGDDDDTQV